MTDAIGLSCWVVGSACTPKFSSALGQRRSIIVVRQFVFNGVDGCDQACELGL